MTIRDATRYTALLQAMANLSGLFSDNASPYVDSRFVEKLFVATSGGRDLGREDCSFDVLLDGNVGVGVKTFLAGTGSSKREKIAEFTSLAREGHFAVAKSEELVYRVCEARNVRVFSDVAEYGIDLASSYYHCLVRLPGQAVVHEEPYLAIDIDSVRPTTSRGIQCDNWPPISEGVFFTDGRGQYSYNVSKNVLFKRFDFDRELNPISLQIHPAPLDLLLKIGIGNAPSVKSAVEIDVSAPKVAFPDLPREVSKIVLPLYSTRDHQVQERSGINQWNAAGRRRALGEAYIPIPAVVHSRFPDFFPPRDQSFDLVLPNSSAVHTAKVCQDGGKALMTDPNFELGRWLIGVIDPSIPESAFSEPVGNRPPYTYSDLLRIGKDSVCISKISSSGRTLYRAEFAPVGAFEEFVE